MAARRPRAPRPAPPTAPPPPVRTLRVVAILALLLVAAGGWWWWSRPVMGGAWPAAGLPGGNVLLVTIDTLRADRLTPTVMPNLSRLAGDGHRFPTTYAHAPLTLPSHSSILTGLTPPAHGVRGNGAFRLADDQVTLAERLHDRGYRTGAFVGAFVLDPRFGLAQGFDTYGAVDDERPFAQDFDFAQRRADAVLAQAGQWILDGDQARPWFAWVHLFDPHAPYDAPMGAGTLGAYDAEAHYADAALGTFLDRLRSSGSLTRTLIVVTADHGESLGEHGEQTHGLFAYDATMRVPLVVEGPGLGSGVHDRPAAHVDIVPTVLEALGLPMDPALPGRPLRDVAAAPSSARAIYMEAMDGWLTARSAPLRAVVADGWKLVDVPRGEVYDLAADPGEATNLWDREPEQRRALETRLASLETGTAAPATAAPRDSEAEARLRALGYASGGSPDMDAGVLTDADDPKVVRPLYERFLDLLGAGSPDADALLAIVAERPSFDAARLAAASVLIDEGRAQDAVAALEPAASTPGASLALRERLGAALLAAGEAAGATTVLSQAVDDPEASADAWNALGVARAQAGQPAAALAAFDRAVSLAPASARILFNRALGRLAAGDAAGGETDLAALTTSHPGMADAWRLLATVRFQQGDATAAVVAWQGVASLEPGDADTLFNLAVALRDLGRLDEARTWARRFDAAIPPGSHPSERRELATLLASP